MSRESNAIEGEENNNDSLTENWLLKAFEFELP